MKRIYGKPTIHVEVMSLDMPVAASCYDNTNADIIDLKANGWFVVACGDMNLENNKEVWDGLGVADTICYHSNITVTLNS